AERRLLAQFGPGDPDDPARRRRHAQRPQPRRTHRRHAVERPRLSRRVGQFHPGRRVRRLRAAVPPRHRRRALGAGRAPPRPPRAAARAARLERSPFNWNKSLRAKRSNPATRMRRWLWIASSAVPPRNDAVWTISIETRHALVASSGHLAVLCGPAHSGSVAAAIPFPTSAERCREG